MTQCVVDPDSPAFKQAEKLRHEFVVRFDGDVRKRPAGTENGRFGTKNPGTGTGNDSKPAAAR